MKAWIPVGVIAVACAVTVTAQDSTVKSRTKIKTDDAKVVLMTGCLQSGSDPQSYTLWGSMAAAGNEMTTKSKTKTDVDHHDGRVDTKVRSQIVVDGDPTVGTGGSRTTYELVPKAGVNLSQYVGQEVQIGAVMADPSHHDAKVKIEDKTTTDPEHGRDSTAKSKTKLDLPRGSMMAVSVKSLASTCTP